MEEHYAEKQREESDDGQGVKMFLLKSIMPRGMLVLCAILFG